MDKVGSLGHAAWESSFHVIFMAKCRAKEAVSIAE